MLKLKMFAARFRKSLAAAWGTLTTPAVLGVLALLDVHLDANTVTVLIGLGAVILGPAAVAVSKPNAPGRLLSKADRSEPDHDLAHLGHHH